MQQRRSEEERTVRQHTYDDDATQDCPKACVSNISIRDSECARLLKWNPKCAVCRRGNLGSGHLCFACRLAVDWTKCILLDAVVWLSVQVASGPPRRGVGLIIRHNQFVFWVHRRCLWNKENFEIERVALSLMDVLLLISVFATNPVVYSIYPQHT